MNQNDFEQLAKWRESLRTRRPETAQSIRDTDEIRYITAPVLIDIETYVETARTGKAYIIHCDESDMVMTDDSKRYRVLIVPIDEDNDND